MSGVRRPEYLAIMMLLASTSIYADVSIVSSASGKDTDNDDEFTFSLSVPVNTEAAVVGITNRDGNNTSWVRFDGQANMTFVINSISSPNSDMDERAQLYYFLNPPAGNQTVRVKLSGSSRHKAAGCILLNGINAAALASPTAKCDENNYSNNPAPTLTFTGAQAPTGSLVISVINNRGNALDITGATHTERWHEETTYLTANSNHGGGTAPGSSSAGVSVSWQPGAGWPTEANWGMVAMVIPANYYGITAIVPDALSVNDSDPANTVIGSLTATDPDDKPPYTWSLLDAAGGRFALNPSTSLEVDVKIANAALIDFGQDETHTIRVGARNAEYPTLFEKDIVITVVDTTPPVVGTAVSSRQYARWGEFVTFSTEITDNATLAGAPVMTLSGTPLVFSNQSGDLFSWGWNVPPGAPDGYVSVSVAAQDTTGNETSLDTDNLLIIDNTPPSISDLSVSHQYAKAGDVVTIGVDILDFYGLAGAPTVTLAGIDGGTPVFDGVRRYTWQIGITAGFPEGSADVLVTALDHAGNQSQGSGPAMVIIDQTPPTIGAFTSTHQYAKLNDTVTLQASVLDNYGLTSLPKMYLHGNMLNPPTVSGNTYYWHIQITDSVQQGDAVIVVEATDFAGWVASASPASNILVIDYTQPNIMQLTCTPSLAKGGMALTLTARVMDNYGLAGTPRMNINGWPVPAPSQAGYIYTWNYLVPSSPTPIEGPAEITILATDWSGNSFNLLDTSKLTYDPNAPIFSEVSVSPSIARLGQTPNISVHIHDISTLNATPTLTVNGVSAVHTGVTDLGNHTMLHTFSFSIAAATPEGDATLSFWAKDILNNERTSVFTGKLLVDKTAPAVSNVSVSPSVSRAGGMVNITFDAVDALTQVDGNPTVAVNGASAAFHTKVGDHYVYRYTVRSSALDPDGPAVVFISCRDTVGNTSSSSYGNLLNIDNSMPGLSNLVVFPNIAREGDAVTIGFKAFDDSGLGDLPQVKVNGNPASFIAAQGNTFEYRYTARAAYDDEGYALLYIRIIDGVGNVLTSESTGLLLIDFTPPNGSLTINNNDVLTRTAKVTLNIEANDGPLGSGTEGMCFSDDGSTWSAWEPYSPVREWSLQPGQGYKTVYVRLRDYTGNVSMLPISDMIALKPNPLIVDREGTGEVKGLLGMAIVLEVSPRNVFGNVQSYEWFKDGQPIEGYGPVLAVDNFEEQDMGLYVCRVADEIETAESQPFAVGISEETPVPASSKASLIGGAMALLLLGYLALKRSRRIVSVVLAGVFLTFLASGVAEAEVTVVYSARAERPMDLSDAALKQLAVEQGSIEIWTRRDDGTVRRQLVRLGEPGIANPGFSSHHREDFASYLQKGHMLDPQKDGSEQMAIPLSDEAILVYAQHSEKSSDEPTFEMKVVVDGEVVLSEKRYETLADGVMRPHLLRVDYPSGAMVQVFEFTDTPPTPLPPVYLRKVGLEDDEKSDSYPKSWVTKDTGDTQTREVQFIVPPQGLGSLGFDSGWVPGGSGPDPGGFIIQVRINASAGYTYDAAVNGLFNLEPESILGLGPAAGSWGFYFGAEFFMKAAFDLPTIFGFDIPPFEVDIPYVPDFNMVASDRDTFNSWLLEEESTVKDEAGRTNVASVDLVSILITQGILPELPDWIPLPKIGAALDVGAIANGRLACSEIRLTDGNRFIQEGQSISIYVPQTGYQAIAEYDENAELNLGVKFYPFVFVNWFSFGFSWPTDFEDPDNLLARLEWLPISHTSFPFTNAELNFTGQPSTQPANDWFTQHFQPVIDTNDVSHKQVRFTPNLSNNFYAACLGDATAYRTNPSGGIPVTLGNDDFVKIDLTDNKQVTLYGEGYSSIYIGSNGYITFNEGDATDQVSLENHFNQPRISGLFLDMSPDQGGTISYKQLPNRMVVTYHAVRLANIITPQTANFQIEMFFDGRIVITWLQLDTYVGLIGLSRGEGVPENYQKSRFTNYPGCLTDIAEEYGIRVNFSPPEVLPYQPRWRTGSGNWQSSGTYVSVPLGENWVYYNYIPIYWEAPETSLTHVNTPDVFVDLTPVWKRSKGTVEVTTQPLTAAWTITDADGIIHSGTGPATLENMPTGMTSIQWQPLPTYSLPTPSSQIVMLYAGNTISFSGNYPPIIGEGTAYIKITLVPDSVVAAGAQWRINGGAWLDSGYTATVPDGDATFDFKEVSGWTKPAPQTLFIQRDITTELIKGYGRHKGSILVDTDPNNAPWTLTDGDGLMHSGTGDTGLQNIPTGDALSILWEEVGSYSAPAPNPTVFSLAQGEVKRVIGAYTPVIGDGEGIVRVYLYPQAAVNAGAQWRLFGGEWRSSGGMNASPDGENTLLFKPLPGWIAPDDMTITVVRDITNSFNASYERLTSDVSIQVQPPSAWWTLTDADGGTHTGMGNMALAGIPTGEATITWGEIEGFETPQPNPGVYTVEAGETLVISGEYVEAVVTADFSAFPLLGAPPLEVNFTDLSDSTTKDIVEWRWYFGDGRTSSERNPSHVYREPGTYTVTLSVTTMEQMNVISKKSYITVTTGLPVAGGAGLILVAAAFVLSGMRLLNKRTR